jgi:hypothetical protein
MVLESVPYSGVSRSKLISNLSDGELGQLCDFSACLSANGYGRSCSTKGPQYQPQTIAPLQGISATCYPAPATQSDSWGSRGECMATYRKYFNTCHVAPWEDCLRELSSDPLGAPLWGPDCDTVHDECPVN